MLVMRVAVEQVADGTVNQVTDGEGRRSELRFQPVRKPEVQILADFHDGPAGAQLPQEVRAVNAFDVQVEPDDLRLDLPEGMEVIVVTGGPTVVGMAVGKQAAVDDAIFNQLLGFNLQDPQLQRAVASILREQARQPTVVEQSI